MCVALLSMSALAQEKGDVAVGLRSGVNITKIKVTDIEESVTNFGIGAFGQYSLSDNWRLELEGIYHPMKNHVSDITVGLNVHYLFHLSDAFKIYPSVGYALAFVHSEAYTITGKGGASQQISHDSENETDGGIQVGAVNIVRGSAYGLQIAFVNFAEDLHGVQIGGLNFNNSGLKCFPIINIGF